MPPRKRDATMAQRETDVLTRQRGLIAALEALVEAQDALLIAYRLSDQRRGARAASAAIKAREAVRQRREALDDATPQA